MSNISLTSYLSTNKQQTSKSMNKLVPEIVGNVLNKKSMMNSLLRQRKDNIISQSQSTAKNDSVHSCLLSIGLDNSNSNSNLKDMSKL
eukprot:gnl/Chilomastix_caulleri/3053.p1 GENE.gnl/Chilomastix_caulleri/3053~~gnl/Chilomastix_caulleri/3053.p1  ORF type:complete len:88 (-),score=5.62 gnl/Chilomastix_caulleri/3053:9-272(-)